MSTLTIYHGSQQVIERPKFGIGNPYNDYGLGFYCTETPDLAKEWACSLEMDGIANKYSLQLDGLSVLSLTSGGYNILNWLAILLENRRFRTSSDVAIQAREYILDNFLIDYKKYDVIKGCRADDSYFSFANAFLNNTISVKQLEKAMVLGKLGEQIVLMSEKAFDALAFEDAIIAPSKTYFPKKKLRDDKAREEFRQEKNKGSVLNEKYVLDIMREGWKDKDERLQRIVLR